MTNAAGPVEPTDAGEGNGSGKWIKTSRNALAWILLAVAGFLLNDAYSWARDKAMDKPDYLQELARDQEQQFKALKDSLGKISSSIDSGDRAAFKQVKDAVSAMGDTNASLIQQLVLAKQENETLRRIAGDKAGVSGGYDFILAEGSGIRVDRGSGSDQPLDAAVAAYDAARSFGERPAGLLRLNVPRAVIPHLIEPVLKGFIIGLALTIVAGQLPKLFGFSVDGDGLRAILSCFLA